MRTDRPEKEKQAPEPFDAQPEPNVDSPEHLMPTEGGGFATDPVGTTDAQHMREGEPANRPNSTSEPE